MTMPAFLIASTSGIGILRVNKRARTPLSGEPPDEVKETHVRAGISGRGPRCAGLQEVWA
jgi:hypothetical protein